MGEPRYLVASPAQVFMSKVQFEMRHIETLPWPWSTTGTTTQACISQ